MILDDKAQGLVIKFVRDSFFLYSKSKQAKIMFIGFISSYQPWFLENGVLESKSYKIYCHMGGGDKVIIDGTKNKIAKIDV